MIEWLLVIALVWAVAWQPDFPFKWLWRWYQPSPPNDPEKEKAEYKIEWYYTAGLIVLIVFGVVLYLAAGWLIGSAV